jgi:hypothetical protein
MPGPVRSHRDSAASSNSGTAVVRPDSLPFASPSNLGRVGRIREVSGSTVYEGVWTRRGSSNTFDGVWPGAGVTDALTLESVSGNTVVFSPAGHRALHRHTFAGPPAHNRWDDGLVARLSVDGDDRIKQTG